MSYIMICIHSLILLKTQHSNTLVKCLNRRTPAIKFQKWPKAAAQLSFPIPPDPPPRPPFRSQPSTMFEFTIFLVTLIDRFRIGWLGNQQSHLRKTLNGLVVLNSFKISNFLKLLFNQNSLQMESISSQPELINLNFVFLNSRKCQ